MSESDVYTAAAKICDPKSFRTYKFIPPKMADGCFAVQDKYKGELEEDLFRAYKAGTEGRFCDDLCKAAASKPKKKSSPKKPSKGEGGKTEL